MSERGSATPLVGMVLLVGLVMLVLGVEIGRYSLLARSTAAAADAAARSGASAIDVGAAYRSTTELDPVAAEGRATATAWQYPGLSPLEVEASAEAGRVCVTVTASHQTGIGRAFGLDDRLITITSCAAPARG